MTDRIRSLLLVLIVTLIFPFSVSGQSKAPGRKPLAKSSADVGAQWWIGIRAGVNLNSASVSKSYSVFSYPVDVPEGDNEKKYDAFSAPALEFGFSVSYEFMRGLSVNLLPVYASNRLSYTNTFSWSEETEPDNLVQVSYDIATRLQYVQFPLTVKYELTQSKFKPYVQVGGYYGLLTDAIKKVKTANLDRASGADEEKNVTELSVGIDDRIRKNNYGVQGGVGFTWNLGNARFGLEANYQYGLQNLDKSANKYYDNQLLTGVYDVPDDYSLNTIEILLQAIIPLKFITSKEYVPL
jgi:hypothetical protein